MKEEKKENIFSKIKEMKKDKKGRAILELSIYFIIFIAIILFVKISSLTSNNHYIESADNTSFIYELEDNYEYKINISYNEDNYHYQGRVLGNNASIKYTSSIEEKYYYLMNSKYYELDSSGNYILTTSSEVYPYIDYKYLDINNIKNYINYSTKEDNIYKIKLSDIILNSNSEEYMTIIINEENKVLEIDYTNLFKIDNENINKVLVTITYSNINNITSLEE